MSKEEVINYLKSLPLWEFHEIIKTEAVRRCKEGEFDNLELSYNKDMRPENVAIITLAHISYFN